MARVKKKILFVDGYNIINSWARLNSVKNDSLEEARELLISEMQEYRKLTAIEVYLVFDSYREKRPITSEEKRGDIVVVFTKEFETADSYIERKCNLLGKDEEVRVATSDMTLQNSSLGSGATRISSREFELEFENLKKNAKENYKRKNIEVKKHIVSLTNEQIRNIDKLKDELLDNNKKSN